MNYFRGPFLLTDKYFFYIDINSFSICKWEIMLFCLPCTKRVLYVTVANAFIQIIFVILSIFILYYFVNIELQIKNQQYCIITLFFTFTYAYFDNETIKNAL